MGEEGQRESLNYKLLGTTEDLGGWGHEYVRHLAGEIGDEYNERLGAADEGGKPAAELLPLILEKMLPFFMAHNTESGGDRFADGGGPPRRAAPARRRDELRPRRDVPRAGRVVRPRARGRRGAAHRRQVPPQARQGARGAPPRPPPRRHGARRGDPHELRRRARPEADGVRSAAPALRPSPRAPPSLRAPPRPRFPVADAPSRSPLQVHARATRAAPRGGGGPGAPDGRHAHDGALPRARARPRRLGAEDA